MRSEATSRLERTVGRRPDDQPLLPELAEGMTQVNYLDAVADFWAQGPATCDRCCLYHGPGYCAMLHDREIPDIDCLGLRERDGVRRPWRVPPNAAVQASCEATSPATACCTARGEGGGL